MLWPLLGILGVSWLLSVHGGFPGLLRWIAAAMFGSMGVLLWRHADAFIAGGSRLTRLGM